MSRGKILFANRVMHASISVLLKAFSSLTAFSRPLAAWLIWKASLLRTGSESAVRHVVPYALWADSLWGRPPGFLTQTTENEYMLLDAKKPIAYHL